VSRRTARQHSFNLVFQIPFHTDWDEAELQNVTANYFENLPDLFGLIQGVSVTDTDRAFIEHEITGVFNNLVSIDNLLSKRLRNWRLDRISKIDLALLRLAVYEIEFFEDISPGTAISEAIRLAKSYGAAEAPKFINGLLGKVARDG